MEKKRVNKFMVFLMIFSLVIILWIDNGTELSSVTKQDTDHTFILQLTPHEKIVIESDADFEALGFSGEGTETNPYLIENLEIETARLDDICLYITNTSKHFIIQNCKTIKGDIGISIENIDSGTAKIMNVNCSFNRRYGISIINVTDVCISDSFTDGTGNIGFRFKQCSKIEIKSCLVLSPFGTGIMIFDSNELTIVENNITTNLNAIMCQAVTQMKIHRNILKNCGGFGVELNPTSSGNVIYHNDFIDNNIVGAEELPQGYDLNGNNLWYNDDIDEGNYWSNYEGEGTYKIDGEDVYDLYPLEERVFHEEDISDETSFTFIVLVITLGYIAYLFIKHKRAQNL